MAFLAIFLALFATLLGISARSAHAEIKILGKPLWIFPGQRFRVALEQPPGSGDLDVDAADSVEMFDKWPRDNIQRFYFRAKKTGDATLKFYGKAGKLVIPLAVIPWDDVFESRKFEGINLPRIWPLDVPKLDEIKTKRTLYTGEFKTGGKVDKLAQKWLSMSDEKVFNVVPGSDVPRTCLIVLGGYEDAMGKGCPVCGMDVYEGRSGFYPWIFDPDNHPWKVGCPSCGKWFPSNDWANGDMHSGDFPDDGFGCEPVKPILAPNGKPWRWPFIAYYHEWPAYMNELTPGIQKCAEAFANTGDRGYAHKAAIGLFRLAESLLDMSINLNHRKTAVRNGVYQPPVGAPDQNQMKRLSQSFLYIQPNWDTPRFENCARAWDMIFDQLEDDEELVKFCREHHHPEIASIRDFRYFIEAGLCRVVAQACMDDAVSRNYPMQESVLATMALALNTPKSLELLDWLLNEGSQLRFGLTNEYYKDGAGHESEGYNGIQIKDMETLIQTLERVRALNPDKYKEPRFVSLRDDPKYKYLYDFPINDSLIGRIYPGAGDTGQKLTADPWTPNQTFPMGTRDYVDVYRSTGDPRFAQILYGPDGKIPADLIEPELRAEVERIGKEKGWQVDLKSNILDGFGHAILRSGQGDYQRALWVRYGRSIQHAHPDMLTMGFEAFKRRMLPELGYPQGWTYASSWETNWGTHYGTHITGISTGSFPRGCLTLFADSPPARIAKAEVAVKDGESIKAYRSRTIILVDISDKDCYAISLERVMGGKEHRWSFHGPDGEAEASRVDLIPGSGTVLKENVDYGDVSELPGNDRELSCLAFMYDPKVGRPEGIWSLDYALRNQDDVHFRMTMVNPDDAELTVAKGKAPGGKSEYEMTWAILRSEGNEPLSSQYLCVMEPYEKQRIVQKIERVKLNFDDGGNFSPLALRIVTNEYVDTIILNGESTMCQTEDGIICDGEFGFLREKDGKMVKAVMANGSVLSKGALFDKSTSQIPLAPFAKGGISRYEGAIESCDFSNFSIKVTPKPQDAEDLIGKHIFIYNDAGNSAAYLIKDARSDDDGCIITLDLDPRIGEGFVGGFEDGCLISKTHLRMARFGYYAGKTLSNEDNSSMFKLKDVQNGIKCQIYEPVSKEELARGFDDKDGDGLNRFLIYDYGPGDRVSIKNISR